VTLFFRSRTTSAIGCRAFLSLLLLLLGAWRDVLGSDFVNNMPHRHVIAPGASLLKIRKLNFYQLLCFVLTLGFALCGIRATPAQADPFQRYIIFYNDLPITIYPVITAVESQQGDACGTSGLNRRIIVNAGTLGAGIPTNGTVTVELPKDKHCWYTAVRVYLFTVDLAKFEAKIPAAQRTVADNATWNPPLCMPVGACWSGTAVDQYPLDAPAQLYEYTVISQNPATGAEFPDPNDPNGIPLADIDVSYVDELYLPVASNVDDGGATPYMGTVLNYAQFNEQTQAFINLTTSNKPLWSEFAAYTTANWTHNVFNKLGFPASEFVQTDHIVGKDIVAGVRIIPPAIDPLTSELYDPPYTGPKQCKAVPACSNLDGDCCPTPDGTILGCCGKPVPYLLSNTTKTASLSSVLPRLGLSRLGFSRLGLLGAAANPAVDNPSVDALVASWTNWVRSDPCANLGAIAAWPSGTTLDKQLFCSMFESTVRDVWNAFKDSPNVRNPNGTITPGCISFTGVAKDQCTVDSIIAFKSDNKGLLNEQVQSLLRNVPYGTFNQTRWSFDKFILFWAPYVSPFNLFPYAHLVHNAVDGVNAPGAYSFSIDDKFGNFGGLGSGILVEVGGNTHLLNQNPYDLWEQFRVSFGSGWNHATVCGRPYTIPMSLGFADPISFWMNGQPQTPCNIVMYKDAAETQFAKFVVDEASNTVTDTYTGQTQTVTQLTYDPSSCNSNLNAVCSGSHLVFTAVPQPVPGNMDPDPGESWVSLSDADKPLVTLVVPAVAP
jgi:hypothetical protein